MTKFPLVLYVCTVGRTSGGWGFTPTMLYIKYKTCIGGLLAGLRSYDFFQIIHTTVKHQIKDTPKELIVTKSH